MNKWAWQGLLALTLVCALPPFPAAAETSPAPTVAPDNPPIPLMLNGTTIMVFRSPFMGLSPAERAEGAKKRLQEFLQTYGYDEIGVGSTPQGPSVTIHEDIMFVVTPGDIRDVPGANLRTTAEQAAEALRSLESQERMEAFKSKVTGFKVSTKWLLILVGVAGAMVGGLYFLKSRYLGGDPGSLECPRCGNKSSVEYEEEPSSFRVIYKYHCRACDYRWYSP